MFAINPQIQEYEIVDSVEKMHELKNLMLKVDEFAFDTETNSLRVLGKNSQFKLVAISISWGDSNNYYIPLGHIREEDIDSQLELETAVEYLKPVFERKDVRIVGWNLKFDMHVMKRVGIHIKTSFLYDAMVMSWLCDENEPSSLKHQSSKYLRTDQTKFSEVMDTIPKEVKKEFGFKSNSKGTFDLVLIEDAAPYALADAFYTWELYIGFKDLIEQESMGIVYRKVYQPFIRTLFDMEERGVSVDVKRLIQMETDMKAGIEALNYRIIELAGAEFNPSSSQQLAELLYGYIKPKKDEDPDLVTSNNPHIQAVSFGFPIEFYTKGGSPSTDNNTIWHISRKQYKNYRKKEGVEMCVALLDYKKLDKLFSAFVVGLREQLYEDGKVHPSFNIIGTDSGRLSCIAKDTPIKVVGGDKPIQDINAGDLVYCYDNDGNLRISKVTRTMNNGIRPVVKVTMRSQGTHEFIKLVCTPDHKIRLRDGNWVRADSLKIEKLELCYNHQVYSVEPFGIAEVYDLEVADYHNFIASEVCVHNCSDPNLQQLPKADEGDKYQIRSLFIGGRYLSQSDSEVSFKRKKIVSIDFSNLEMRVLAHFSQDENLLKMFANNEDSHGSTAVNMFELDCAPSDVKKLYPHLRQAAKTINFMLMYGGGAFRLYSSLNEDRDNPINLGEQSYLDKYKVNSGEDVAQIYIDKYFSTYSGVASFIKNQKRFAKRNGYVYTVLQRKRRLPDINSRDYSKVSYCERLSVNSTIQGSAADITINAQNRISKDPFFISNGIRMLIQVHDELVFECPESLLDVAIEKLKHYMEHPFGDDVSLNLPLIADAGFGNNYQEAK